MARKRKSGTSPVVWMLRGLLIAVLVGVVVAFAAERAAAARFDAAYARVKPLVEVSADKRPGPAAVEAAAGVRPMVQEKDGGRIVRETYRIHGIVRTYDFLCEYGGREGSEILELVKPLQ